MLGILAAVAMLGAPLALSLGVPAGTFLGAAVGWRLSFAIMTGLTLLLLVWARWQLPDFAGQPEQKRLGLRQVLSLRGIRPVLWVTFTYVLAHNILYTYIAPLLVPAGIVADIDRILLVFGLAALLSIWLTGMLIDQHLRRLLIISCVMFAVSALALGVWMTSTRAVYASVALWGLAFGGLPALLQTALAKSAGDSAGAVNAGDGVEPGDCRRRASRRYVATNIGGGVVPVGGCRVGAFGIGRDTAHREDKRLIYG